MALVTDPEAFKKSLASLPIAVYVPGESVLDAGSTSGRLFILKTGQVEVLRDGVQIAVVSEPGAVFGELAVILNKPHTADVRAVERSEFHVAEGASLLTENRAALLYVTALLAQRLDTANDAIVEVKRDLESGHPPGAIKKALRKLEKLLAPAGPVPDYYYYPY